MNTTSVHSIGRVAAIEGGVLKVTGLANELALGDLVEIERENKSFCLGEVVSLDGQSSTVIANEGLSGMTIGRRIRRLGTGGISPSKTWIGRVIDPFGRPLDGRSLSAGGTVLPVRGNPSPDATRRGFGPRLETGLAAFNTLLPIARGQRLGLFAGAGVGKSTLLARLATRIEADLVVVALVGERGREVTEFTQKVLGPSGLKRSIVVAATSDLSAMARRRCLWSAMTIAEYFRDRGQHVLFLADSITRFAEAHREIALALGEPSSMRGYPPSVQAEVTALTERAGTGAGIEADITAILSVLVAGSDMDEPIADILRGVLDGHIVLDRRIAERGRYPAVDAVRSLSRSLPEVATHEENALIEEARSLLGAHDRAELMLQSGLYTKGADAKLDRAVRVFPALDAFLAADATGTSEDCFARLGTLLKG